MTFSPCPTRRGLCLSAPTKDFAWVSRCGMRWQLTFAETDLEAPTLPRTPPSEDPRLASMAAAKTTGRKGLSEAVPVQRGLRFVSSFHHAPLPKLENLDARADGWCLQTGRSRPTSPEASSRAGAPGAESRRAFGK